MTRAPEPRTFSDDVWLGAITPSAASFVGAVIFCVIEILACCIAFQPRVLVRLNTKYLMESPTDYYPELTRRLLALRVGPPCNGLHVAYLGASQATRSLQDRDPEVLSNKLSEAAGRPVCFDFLSSDSQRFEESLAITDQFPPSFRGVLVQFVTDYKDDYGRKEHRAQTLGRIAVIDAPSLEPFLAAEGYVPRHTGLFFYDNLGFFAARRIAALRPAPADLWKNDKEFPDIAEVRQRATIRRLLSKIRRGESDEETEARRHEDAGFFTSSRKVVDRLVSNMRARGIPIVFVEAPDHPLRAELFADRVKRFHDEMHAFVRDNGAEFWQLDPELDLTPEDFSDGVHLESPRARRRFQRILFERLGAYLGEHFAEAAGR